MKYEHPHIVVGSSLNALLFAFVNKYPVFFAQERRPFRFDHFPIGTDLSCLKISMSTKSLTTFEGEKEVGIPKELLWERLLFLLGLEGQLPLSNLCHTLRMTESSLVCSNEYSKIAEINFERCYYFGDEQSVGIVKEKALDPPQFMCYDWIAFNRGGKHDIDYIEFDDDLVREIWFYPSDRIDGTTAVKDACVVSTLTGEQLRDFSYSETMARFKLVHQMESLGMKGKFNGYGPNGKPKHYKFRTSSIARQKNERRSAPEPQASNIEVPQDSEESLLEALPPACVGYDRLLRHL
jgi:hypothetical protein